MKSKELKMQRVTYLKTEFREVLFKNVCMSLFEHHKLLFAFFMTLKIFEQGESEPQSFAERLKQLDRLHPGSDSSKKYDSESKHESDSRAGINVLGQKEFSRRGSARGADEI